MSRHPRRNHKSTFKTKTALAAIRGKYTLGELTEKNDVHPNQLKQWRDQLLEGAVGGF